MYAAGRVDGHIVRMGEHHAGSTQRCEGLAVADGACTYGGGGVIACAAHHRRTLGKTGQSGGLRRHGAGHVNGFIHAAQQRRVDVQLVQDLVGPLPPGHVQQIHAGGVGYLGGKLAGEAVADVVFGQQDMTAGLIDLRQMLAHPQDLSGGKTRQSGICGDGDEPFCTHRLGDLAALLAGAAIAPQNAAVQHSAVLVQHHQTMHLSGDTYTGDIGGGNAACMQHGLHRFLHGAPPVARFLFGPAVLGLVEGVFCRVCGHGRAVAAEQDRLGAGGAQVDAQQIFLHSLRLLQTGPPFRAARSRCCFSGTARG